jgi:mannitol 2-dehydrogenase
MSNQGSGSKPIALSNANLKHLLPSIPVPPYDRSRLVHSIVHIGVGGFFRAHQTVYLDDLIQKSGNMDWGICGVGLLKQDRRMYEAMKNQDCLYTVVERSVAGDKPRVIGSMTGFLFAPDDPEAVIEKMASPVCRIVTMTITEGGYYVNSGTGAFDAENPDIKHDLADPAHPCCVFGYLALALERRKARGLGPFTLMSCDNMQNNGDVLKKMLLAFLNLRNRELGVGSPRRGPSPTAWSTASRRSLRTNTGPWFAIGSASTTPGPSSPSPSDSGSSRTVSSTAGRAGRMSAPRWYPMSCPMRR